MFVFNTGLFPQLKYLGKKNINLNCIIHMPSHDSFDNKNEKQEIPHCRNSFQIPIAKL